MVTAAASTDNSALVIACMAYAWSAFGTFLFSSLSHAIHRQPMLNTLRAWDQAMIYTMIAGTYTPIVVVYAPEWIRTPLVTAIWIAAISGFVQKVVLRHRVNGIETLSYLLLGWLPAIPLYGRVPTPLLWSMGMGGILYTVGVVFLMNDFRMRYMHAIWHLFVVVAAACHFLGILWYVVG
jgi:hemolysin III